MSSNATITKDNFILYMKNLGLEHYADETWKIVQNVNIHFVIDRSRSTDCILDNKVNKSIYTVMCDNLIQFYDFSTLFDNDGISLSFLNDNSIYNIKNKVELKNKLNAKVPGGDTPLLRSFNLILNDLKNKEGKKNAIVIWTDGHPSDCNINEFTENVKSALNSYRNMSVNIVVFTQNKEINDLYKNMDDGSTERLNIVLNPISEEKRVKDAGKLKGEYKSEIFMLIATLGGHCKTIGDLNNVGLNSSVFNVFKTIYLFLIFASGCFLLYYIRIIWHYLYSHEISYMFTYDFFCMLSGETNFRIFFTIILSILLCMIFI